LFSPAIALFFAFRNEFSLFFEEKPCKRMPLFRIPQFDRRNRQHSILPRTNLDPSAKPGP
jgi:hypothetical protein